MKRTPAKSKDQLRALFTEHLDCVLPRNRNQRNGDRLPLTAWMRGAQPALQSKIMAVCTNRAKPPYRYPGQAVRDLSMRIAKRYDITWVQLDLLYAHVFAIYRGKKIDAPAWMGTVAASDELWFCKTRLPMKEIDNACIRMGISPRDLPLRAILDKRLTQFVLLKQLDETILERASKTQRRA